MLSPRTYTFSQLMVIFKKILENYILYPKKHGFPAFLELSQ